MATVVFSLAISVGAQSAFQEVKKQPGEAIVVPIVKDAEMTLIPILAGEFMMGSKNGRSDERPVRRVRISQPFWMGKTEVTQAQYQAVMGDSIESLRDKVNKDHPLHGKGAGFPVYYVSWDDAVLFCEKLTERERRAGRLPEGYAYALPTEAQWEYACRAETTGDHAGKLDEMGWYGMNSGNLTHPVATLQPNAWGLCDMHGNVWEWCADWYGGYPPRAVSDPRGASSGSRRAIRGGAWNYKPENNRSAYRHRLFPTDATFDLGFRVVLVRE